MPMVQKKSRLLLLAVFAFFGSLSCIASSPSKGNISQKESTAYKPQTAGKDSSEVVSKTALKKEKQFGRMADWRHYRQERRAARKAEECDVLLLTSGEELEGKVTEIGINTITYKKCGWPDGPDYKIERNTVASITYANGTVEQIEAIEYVVEPPTSEVSVGAREVKNTRVLSITGFIFSLLSIPIPFLAIPGIVISAIAMRKGRSYPEQGKRRLAAAGLAISIIVIVAWGGILTLFILT